MFCFPPLDNLQILVSRPSFSSRFHPRDSRPENISPGENKKENEKRSRLKHSNIWRPMFPLVGDSLGSDGERSLTPSESSSDDDNDDRRSPFRASSSSSSPSSLTLPPTSSSVSLKARQLGVDVVVCTHPKNLSRLTYFPIVIDVILHDDVSIVMRKIVKSTVLGKLPLFRGMIQSVRPADDRDFRRILSEIVGHLVAAGVAHDSPTPNLTWAKIVTAYAFGGFFANEVILASSTSSSSATGSGSLSASASGPRTTEEQLGNIVGDVIDQVAGKWIERQGGWRAFAKHFRNAHEDESLARSLVYLFGASTAAAFGLVFLKTMVH